MKGHFQKKSNNPTITSSATPVRQVEPAQQSIELGTVKFDALLTFRRHGQLKHAHFKALIPNAKTVDIPEQDLDPVSPAIKEQEQVAGQRILVKRLLGQAH